MKTLTDYIQQPINEASNNHQYVIYLNCKDDNNKEHKVCILINTNKPSKELIEEILTKVYFSINPYHGGAKNLNNDEIKSSYIKWCETVSNKFNNLHAYTPLDLTNNYNIMSY